MYKNILKRGLSMAVSDKVKAGLKLNGIEIKSLAEFLGITRQSMSNKFSRDSFSAEDLIKIADFLGYSLAFVGDKQSIVFELNDIRADANE
jgi:transcriptional regulator with XRE-family HTH domain